MRGPHQNGTTALSANRRVAWFGRGERWVRPANLNRARIDHPPVVRCDRWGSASTKVALMAPLFSDAQRKAAQNMVSAGTGLRSNDESYFRRASRMTRVPESDRQAHSDCDRTGKKYPIDTNGAEVLRHCFRQIRQCQPRKMERLKGPY